MTRLNLRNPNDDAVRMSNKELATMCRATGVPRPQSSAELVNKPAVLNVALKERTDKPGKFNNEIKGYSSPAANEDREAQQPSNGSSATPPWRK